MAPLRQRVRDMEKEKAKSERELLEINSTLARLTAEIRELSDNYERAASELRSLQEQAALMEKRLTAASKLIMVRVCVGGDGGRGVCGCGCLCTCVWVVRVFVRV